MTLQKTTQAKLKALFTEAEASKAFLASKKDPKKTITDVIQAMVKELDAEIFELKNQEGKAASSALGFAVVFYKDSQLLIGPIYIAKAYQGQGFSKVLLEQIVQLAKSKNLVSIYTKTWGANKASRHLFTSYGFTQTKEVLDDRADGDSTVSYIYQLRSD